jgi:hypothetical protein
LKRVDAKFENEDKALILLNSLPTSPTYDNFITTLMWGNESLELEDVTRALLAFHQRKKNIDENSQGEWLFEKDNYKCRRSSNNGGLNDKNPKSKSRKMKDINCYKCKKKGHMKWDCPDWKKNKDDEKKKVPQNLQT